MPRPTPIIHRIAARPAQIPDRFVGGFGNVHRGEFPSPQQSRQLARIAFVGLTRSPERVGVSEGAPPGTPLLTALNVARGQSRTARFIARSQDHFLAMRFAQSANPLFYRVQIIAERSAFAPSPLRPSSATAVMIQSLWTSSPR